MASTSGPQTFDQKMLPRKKSESSSNDGTAAVNPTSHHTSANATTDPSLTVASPTSATTPTYPPVSLPPTTNPTNPLLACRLCPQTFPSYSAVTSHESRIHFFCQVCRTISLTRQDQIKHFNQTKHGFHCRACDCAWKSVDELLEHECAYVKCEGCRMWTSDGEVLRRHLEECGKVNEVVREVEVIKEVEVEVVKEVEVIKEVPVEVIKEVEIPKEVIKEVEVFSCSLMIFCCLFPLVGTVYMSGGGGRL